MRSTPRSREAPAVESPAAKALADREVTDKLLSVYAVERQDDANALTVAFAITTTGLTYVIAATAYFSDKCDAARCVGIPQWLALTAPSVAVAFVGFLVLNVAASRMRSLHIQRLENEIRLPLQSGHVEPSFHTDAGLVFRPEAPLEPPRIRVVFAIIGVSSYIIIMLALIGFTWVILATASGPWTIWKYIAASGYGVVEFAQILGFAWPLVHPRFAGRAVPSLPH